MAAPPFDYAMWALRFPELAGATPDSLAEQYAVEALLLPEGNRIANDPSLTGAQQSVFINLLVAHLAALNQAGSSPLVGRISSATEGSVSVSSDYPTTSAAAAWYAQTKYGAELWRILGPYRTAQYIVGPGAFNRGQQVFGQPLYAGNGGFGWGGYPAGWPVQ